MATTFTARHNEQVQKSLSWDDKTDFENASRGLIAQIPAAEIKDANGHLIWDMKQFEFLEAEHPSINPSLRRNSQLNKFHGLFKVTGGVYQCRGYDLSNINFVRSNSGWIVIDTLTTTEAAKACLQLLWQHVEKRPVVAVIYTHSHGDHFGGVKGLLSEEDVSSGKAIVVAPEGFMNEVVSENVLAGNCMMRRATYMYGNTVPPGPTGLVDAGLGKTVQKGTITLIPPTHLIKNTGEILSIDGVEVMFQLTPGAEAPSEMNVYLPQYCALCVADNCAHSQHNIGTPRGAQVRDAKLWAHYLDETIELFFEQSDCDCIFAGHQWPTWGKKEIVHYLTEQRDMYKYIHDQTLRLLNHGLIPNQIAEILTLPSTLKNSWACRDYYGTVSHNCKYIYQKYVGWFDGNPSNLHQLPPVEAGKKYVEFMGGPEAVIKKATESFNQGEYRWVAMVLNHLLFAYPDNVEAKQLQANTFEQLGFQAESGPWRNFYLTGAQELRKGPPAASASAVGEVAKAIPPEFLFSALSVRLNGKKADALTLKFKFVFPDRQESYLLIVQNAVLNFWKDKDQTVDCALTIPFSLFQDLLLGTTNIAAAMQGGKTQIKGELPKLALFFSLFDKFPNNFNIVLPNKANL